MRHFSSTLSLIGFAITTLCASCATATPRLSHRSGTYSVEILVNGHKQHMYRHRGDSYVLGLKGRRYTLRIRNRSSRRVEAVVTVDGRDVLDGKSGNLEKRGYLIPAWGSVNIEGWRLSQRDVAAFRFSSVANSYAAKTGSARNVGVIGVAVFPERYRPSPVVPRYYSTPPSDDERGEVERSYDSYGGGPKKKSYRSEGTPAPAQPRASRGRSGNALSQSDSKAMSPRRRAKNRRPGLATAFGERHYSPVQNVTFVRANESRPSRVLGIRYNDRRGLIAMGVDVTRRDRWRREVARRRSADPFPQHSYTTPPPGWR
jgi:hypothetical protein